MCFGFIIVLGAMLMEDKPRKGSRRGPSEPMPNMDNSTAPGMVSCWGVQFIRRYQYQYSEVVLWQVVLGAYVVLWQVVLGNV